MAAAVGAVALEVGLAVGPAGAVDLVGAGCGEVPDTVGVTDTVGATLPEGGAAGLVSPGLDGVVAALDDAWPSAGAVG